MTGTGMSPFGALDIATSGTPLRRGRRWDRRHSRMLSRRRIRREIQPRRLRDRHRGRYCCHARYPLVEAERREHLASLSRKRLERADERLFAEIQLLTAAPLGLRLEGQLVFVRAPLRDLAHRRREHCDEANDERKGEAALEHGLRIERD